MAASAATVKVTYVIITRNRRADVLENLALLRDQAHPHEVVLVDNGSTDGTAAAVGKEHPRVRLVANPDNTGVTGGRNAGIAAARDADLLIFADDDAVIRDKDATATVVAKVAADPTLGILGFQERSYYDPQVLAQWCYGRRRARDWATREFDAWTFPGAGHAIRREVFDQVGTYPERYFYACEEVDLSLRALDAGWRVAYTPDVKVYHKVSPATRAKFRYYFDLRNNIWLSMRLLPAWYGVARTGGWTLRATYLALRNPRHLPRVPAALRDAWRARHEVLKERKPVKKETLQKIWRMRRQRKPS
ncbi:MAG: glycosyltransferase family 2 protein [Candidatus Andersenbacteria bacterium]